MVQPPRKEPPPPPRLCEAGPCVNYHRFEHQLDVEAPMAGSIEPGGKMSGEVTGQPFHVMVHHYCYPTVGVETKLGALPVLKCNRWQPLTDAEVDQREARVREFNFTNRGERYAAEMAAWQEARAAEALESGIEDDVAIWILMWMRDGNEIDIHDEGGNLLESLAGDAGRDLTNAALKQRYAGRKVLLHMMTTDVDGNRYAVSEKQLEV